MATRRANIPLKDDAPQHVTPTNPGTNSDIRPAVPTHVIVKLLIFTVLMIFAPLSTYFFTKATIYSGNATWAGATAAAVANVVLIGYIVVAFLEDEGDKPNTPAKAKKAE